MIPRRIVTVLWSISAVASLGAAGRYLAVRAELLADGSRFKAPTLVRIPESPDSEDLNAAAAAAGRASPFRSDRAPADNAAAAVGPPPSAEQVLLPGTQISLRGILGGPPWTAVLQGIPGTSNTAVMRLGDTLSGFTLARVRRDTVVVRGLGRVFTLTLRTR